MRYVRLGRTGLKVSKICLGTNMFGAGYVDDRRAISVVDEAHEQGVNFIDTADSYHLGMSEHVVGKAVGNRRQSFVIATKGFGVTGPGVNDRGLSRKHLFDAVEGSLRRLNTEYIDLYQVHFWDPDTPLEETLRTLDDLVRQGKVRYIGCSNFAAWQLCRALWISDKHGLERFESVQPLYNLLKREPEQELFPLCEELQVGVVPYQVLLGGVFTGRYDRGKSPPDDSHMSSFHARGARAEYWNDATFDLVERVGSIAAEAGYGPTELALAWALSKPAVTSVIVGCSRPDQVAANANVADAEIPADLLERLEQAGAPGTASTLS